MRGMGRVFKRPGSPFWQIEFWCKGKRHTETSKSLRKQEAKDLLWRRLQEYRIAPGLERRTTVANALEEYVKDCELRGIRGPEQVEARAKILREFFGEERAVEVNASRVRELQAHLLAKGYGNGTVNLIVGTLRTALRLAALEGLIPALPPFPRRLKEPFPRQGFLEHADFVAILEELEPWARDIFRCCYFSGWRLNEVLTLRWEEVDFEGKVVRLDPARSKNGESRVLPIVGEIAVLMEERSRVRSASTSRVFHREGSPANKRTYWGHFKRAATIAGRPGKLPHDTRRTMARNFERAHVERGVAMKLMGHKSESMYRRYAIAAENELAGGAEKLYDYLRKKASEAERQKWALTGEGRTPYTLTPTTKSGE